MVRDLVESALRHTATAVTVVAAAVGGAAELVVDDDRPGVPAADRDRVSERFARLDSPRWRDAGGAGLGLATVRGVVTGHGGSVTAGAAPGGGARLRVELPTALGRDL